MKSKILVVDDENDIRELVRYYLDKEGFTVVEAENGQKALEIVENEYIDLAIVDIMMPVMDGYQALVGIRNIEKERNIPKENQVKIMGLTNSPMDALMEADLILVMTYTHMMEVRNILPHYRWGAIRLFNEYCFGKDIPVNDPSFMPEPVYRQTFLWLQKGCRVIIDRLKTNSLDYDDCK